MNNLKLDIFILITLTLFYSDELLTDFRRYTNCTVSYRDAFTCIVVAYNFVATLSD